MAAERDNRLYRRENVLVVDNGVAEDSVATANIEGRDMALLAGLLFRTFRPLLRLYICREGHDLVPFRCSVVRLEDRAARARLWEIWTIAGQASDLCLKFGGPCLIWVLLFACQMLEQI